MLYTYCKESLSFKQVKAKRIHFIYVALAAIMGYATLTAMIVNAEQKGFEQASNTPAETELVILESTEDQFSQEALVEELKRLNVRYPHIILAQAILETGFYDSRVFKENNNLFGMKEARARATTAKGTQLGHAYYDHWKESVTDYALYQAAYLNKLRTEKKYLSYLERNYAEAKNYDVRLTELIEKYQLKELFLD